MHSAIPQLTSIWGEPFDFLGIADFENKKILWAYLFQNEIMPTTTVEKKPIRSVSRKNTWYTEKMSSIHACTKGPIRDLYQIIRHFPPALLPPENSALNRSVQVSNSSVSLQKALRTLKHDSGLDDTVVT